MSTITNPILPGFNPDPCLVRVGSDVYLATSTFEWWPGVALYHSRDLARWTPVGHALTRRSQLDLIGVPDSGGVWAPCLTWHDGLFHLVFSNVTSRGWPLMGADNFVVTAPAIDGPWSEPTALCGWGWDPSLFHDADGRSWFLSMRMDPRPGRQTMEGIVLCAYDRAARRLVGEPQVIFRGTGLGNPEGPHLYHHDGWYYLVIAEGGTRWGHAVSVARSRAITGPYETDPAGPMLTSRHDLGAPLQKAGHGSLLQLDDGSWWMAHLCARPMPPDRFCPLGRETALQRVVWVEGWPRLAHGGGLPAVTVPGPADPPAAPPRAFAPGALPPELMTLRDAPDPSWLRYDHATGDLLLRGRDVPVSLHRQSVVARRLTGYHARATTVVRYAPTTWWQAAGLGLIYDTRDRTVLVVTHDEALGRCLVVVDLHSGKAAFPLARPIPLPGDGPVHLALTVAGDGFTFAWSQDGIHWQDLPHRFGLDHFGDEYQDQWRFTGAMVALTAWDIHRADTWAAFSRLTYEEPCT